MEWQCGKQKMVPCEVEGEGTGEEERDEDRECDGDGVRGDVFEAVMHEVPDCR